ncbi:MAG: ribosome biogenesis GTPase Der [Crocinitomicaceae bacterium]
MSNIVAIVGRPNVGKSTVFNRLTKSQSAIVEEMSGVTRDRIYGVSDWNGRTFSVIDTGGYVRGSEDIFESEIRKQVEIAIEEANIIVFVSDVTVGITDLDEAVAGLLRKANKPVFVVANKVDNAERANDAFEFYNYGLGDVHQISAINGSGTGDLLDEMVKAFKDDVEVEASDVPRISVVGKPNVGKSSFVNAITGEERNIVTEISGTTRDAVDSDFNLFGFDFKLVDTAGIRKKNKVHEDIEYYSVIRSVRSIEYSDVCILMIDATEGLQKQDLNIYYIIEKNKKGVVVLVNKWDLIENKSPEYVKEYEDRLREDLAPFNDVPIIFTSTLTKQRLHKALEKTMTVYENRVQKIPTSELNNFLQDVIDKNPPPSVKGKFIKIKFVTQLPTHSPSFALFCNLPQYIREDYKRFIENKLRQRFNFEGVPIRIFFRKK